MVRAAGTVVETDSPHDRTRWWTFGGLKANAALATLLTGKEGTIPHFDNYFVEIPGSPGLREIEQRLKAIRLHTPGEPTSDPDLPGKVKFWECLPNDLQSRFMRARFTDAECAQTLLSGSRVYLDRNDDQIVDSRPA